MKIELTDREAWIARVRGAIDSIHCERARRDAHYESTWLAKYEKRGWLRYLIGPLRAKPAPDRWSPYPSYYAWGDIEKLERIEQALLSEGTGAVFVSGDEMRAIL